MKLKLIVVMVDEEKTQEVIHAAREGGGDHFLGIPGKEHR